MDIRANEDACGARVWGDHPVISGNLRRGEAGGACALRGKEPTGGIPTERIGAPPMALQQQYFMYYGQFSPANREGAP